MIGISSLLYDLLRGIVAIYLAVLDPVWHLIVCYGLDPKNSYGIILDPGPEYLSLYMHITDLVYESIIPVSLIIFSLIIAMRSSLLNFRTTRALMNLLIPFLALAFTFRALTYLTLVSEYLFRYLWNYPGINWYSVFSVTGILNFSSGTDSSSTVIVFLYLTSYFIAMSSLLAELIFREAAELLLMMIIPVFAAIAFTGKTQEYLFRSITTFLELNFLPVPVIMDLILASIFSYDPVLELGFFLLAPAIPSLIFIWTRNEGLRMQPLRIPVGLISGFIGGQIDTVVSGGRRIDWSEVYSNEASYRRGESN
ncbi:hypothetical protein [Thermoplasma sp.]|uniref:hypothetical protein n=1 Tax=Thermoplasma sp. TaxID=1973142 RepID=UPI0012796262|nr:hypothetical protein [Thermoplasma sp.]KAA8923483.1 MAG: hypothetical protein F6Q11_00580 [Thermoplasma sp.]